MQIKDIKTCDIKEGDFVIMKQRKTHKFSPNYDTKPYKVVERRGTVALGKLIMRNVHLLKKVPKDGVVDDINDLDYLPPIANPRVEIPVQLDEENDDEPPMPIHVQGDDDQTLRRSNRDRRMPSRYDDYELT